MANHQAKNSSEAVSRMVLAVEHEIDGVEVNSGDNEEVRLVPELKAEVPTLVFWKRAWYPLVLQPASGLVAEHH